MSIDSEEVKEQLRDSGDEFHYRDSNVDIGGDKSGESSVHVSHFVVKRDARGQGIASTVLDALFTVMREERLTSLTIKMGATECKTRDELHETRETQGDSWEDPTYEFLNQRGFRDLSYEEDWQWGLCVSGLKLL